MESVNEEYKDLLKEDPIVSVITVVLNGEKDIEKSIQSVVNQVYKNIEYIIIDGESKDGTISIIRDYSDKISYWISEKDGGIYHAMNKGVAVSSGELICFVNCGDGFTDNLVVSDVVDKWLKNGSPDIIYGNAFTRENSGQLHQLPASQHLGKMWQGPKFRHGAMFIKGELQKKFNFNTDKEYRICADFNLIYHLYTIKCSFLYIKRDIMYFNEVGLSSDIIHCFRDNLMIVNNYTPKFKYKMWYWYRILFLYCRKLIYTLVLPFLKVFSQLLFHYILNNIIPYIPSYKIRHFYYRNVCGIYMGKGSSIHMRCFITGRKIRIGHGTVIGRSSYLDGRCNLTIGSNVSISPHVHIITAAHDIDSPGFSNVWKPITINDYVWIGTRATILPGVTIGEGAVVAVGAIVTKDVYPYEVVAGIPARKIRIRSRNLNYKTDWFPLFD